MCAPTRPAPHTAPLTPDPATDVIVAVDAPEPSWRSEAFTAELPAALPAPRLVAGTRMLGPFEGSGYVDPPHLVARADGQLVRLPPLLHALVALLAHDVSSRPRRRRRRVRAGTETPDAGLAGLRPPTRGYRSVDEVAAALSRATGDDYAAEHIVFLIDRKLAPLGLAHASDGTAPDVDRRPPWLSLRLRRTLLAPEWSSRVGGAFAWMFAAPMVVAVLATFVLAQAWVFTDADTTTALTSTMLDPVGVLSVLLIAIGSAGFHEIGHAAACRFGGVAPGEMGAGIYLVWPAFYTDITATYQLGRAGRIRADLGGVYFNAVVVLGLVAAYLATGWPPLLVAVIAANLEIMQQLLPSLRFDGYYIVSDLAGVPDLFKYIGPIVRRHVLRRPAEPRLEELRPWPQRLVAVWVTFVVPALVIQMAFVVAHLPGIVASGLDEARGLVARASVSAHPVLDWTSTGIRLLFLALPVVGLVYVLWSLLRGLTRAVAARLRRPATGGSARHRPAAVA
jgi:putative peptide zinc metalloprotease protein